MKLHEDRDSFKALLSEINKQTGIREDIIEKDYYVSLLLAELAGKQKGLPAYFKGGTALYKAIGRMIRFSEDIDLTVEVSDCPSNNQARKRLENAANGYKQLQRTSNKSLENNSKGNITSVYEYVSATTIDTDDQLQRFETVKVEATSFTVSEPFEPMKISPLLFSEATPQQKQILISQYDVNEFYINTIKLERIFADKILAAEFYYERDFLFDVSKHLFDLTVMIDIDKIQILLSQPEELIQMLSYKRQEEVFRIGSDLSEKPFSEFTLFNKISSDSELKDAFEKMQRIYVFDEEDTIDFEVMVSQMDGLYQLLITLDEGLDVSEDMGLIMQ